VGNRWGDYSATTLDPNDPTHFWTIQEWAGGSTTWAMQISEIIIGPSVIPEPGTLTLTGIGLVAGLLVRGWRRRSAIAQVRAGAGPAEEESP
jgi:hypothetical protein